MTTFRRAPAKRPLLGHQDVLHTYPLCQNGCIVQARFSVFVHQTDRCDNGTHLTQDGAAVLLLCADCLIAAAEFTKAEIAKRVKRMPKGAHSGCATCSRPIQRLGDVLEVEALNG